ncbi:hypothetical protein Q5H93_24080 [Hymenobacter sp. ASUV-10]|uniref:Uncharacterized protein n=1 Tax=Hymenobacter aranciens TaxID=3063996 RepID=A0ABT9BHV9_9BACT|nr:hypothetical protein [Hymenobacter sp. ASUV-10]MDO7877837.1 hypothetical protein [Hymenobacter sp. ASUV-10]
MFLTLLLQTTKSTTVEITDLTNVYIALGGTLAAAITAAIASFVASSRAAKTAEKVAALSSKTTQEVAELSRKTTQEVATLSATVSREASTLAARTAQELKDKDYKHDFYKRIISKRLGAWEESENLLVSISETMIDEKDNQKFYSFCISGEELNALLDKMRSMMLNQTQWMGQEYGIAYTQFFNFLVEILRESMYVDKENNKLSAVNDKQLILLGKANYEQLGTAINSLLSKLSKLVVTMHDVEPFLEELGKASILTSK